MNLYKQKRSNFHRPFRPARSAFSAVLLLITITFLATASLAADQATVQSQVSLLETLQGNWAATIVGNTGCGLSSMYVTFSLDAAGHGNGTATIVQHAQCADTTTSGLDFNINSLNSSGSGTAGLSCGVGCGWELNIQVARNGQLFGLVDVSPSNPNNYIAGTAIHLR